MSSLTKDKVAELMQELADNKDTIHKLSQRNREITNEISSFMKKTEIKKVKVQSEQVERRVWNVVKTPKKKVPRWGRPLLVDAIKAYRQSTGKAVDEDLANFIIDFRVRHTQVVGETTSVRRYEPKKAKGALGVSEELDVTDLVEPSQNVNHTSDHTKPISV